MRAFYRVDSPNDLACFIFDARKEQGLSQADLARKAGVTSASISKIENGYTNYNPTLNMAIKLVNALGCRLIFAPNEVYITGKIGGKMIRRKGEFEK